MKIRPAQLSDIKAIAKVHVDTWHTTYKGLVSDEALDGLSYKRSEVNFANRLNSPAKIKDYFLFVAENDDGRIVGFIDGGPERSGDYEGYGEIYAIYILQEAQRLGIGKALTHNAIRSLKESDFNKMIIWVLKGNKYEKFYQDLGGKKDEEKDSMFGPHILHLVAYKWEKLL